MESIYNALVDIVGEEYVSNRKEELYIYSQDSGMMDPQEPNFVVLPKTTEEVIKIINLSNITKIPIIASGGALSLSGLTIPHRGGIILDLKRMDNILEVND
jgi:glycolate oxidase